MLIYNGVQVEKVIYNGQELTQLIYNGEVVFEAGGGIDIDYNNIYLYINSPNLNPVLLNPTMYIYSEEDGGGLYRINGDQEVLIQELNQGAHSFSFNIPATSINDKFIYVLKGKFSVYADGYSLIDPNPILTDVIIGSAWQGGMGTAFSNFPRLASVYISGGGVNNVVIEGTNFLSSIEIEEGPTNISRISGTKLTTITVPESINNIANNGLYDNPQLTTCSILGECRLNYNVFMNCSKLSDVYIYGTETKWRAQSKAADGPFYASNDNVRIHLKSTMTYDLARTTYGTYFDAVSDTARAQIVYDL